MKIIAHSWKNSGWVLGSLHKSIFLGALVAPRHRLVAEAFVRVFDEQVGSTFFDALPARRHHLVAKAFVRGCWCEKTREDASRKALGRAIVEKTHAEAPPKFQLKKNIITRNTIFMVLFGLWSFVVALRGDLGWHFRFWIWERHFHKSIVYVAYWGLVPQADSFLKLSKDTHFGYIRCAFS